MTEVTKISTPLLTGFGLGVILWIGGIALAIGFVVEIVRYFTQ